MLEHTVKAFDEDITRLRGLIAEMVPIRMAVGMAIRAVANARWNVAGTRLSAIGSDGTRCHSELPKSPSSPRAWSSPFSTSSSASTPPVS